MHQKRDLVRSDGLPLPVRTAGQKLGWASRLGDVATALYRVRVRVRAQVAIAL